jgi:AcrR family transcriptional regulator
LFAALLARYNQAQDEALNLALANSGPYGAWPDLISALLGAGRRFHDDNPVYVHLLGRATSTAALRDADEAHMIRQGAVLAQSLEAAFHLPEIPRLADKLTLAVVAMDRLWGFGLDENVKIPDETFEESRRMMLSYLASYLPAQLTPRRRA